MEKELLLTAIVSRDSKGYINRDNGEKIVIPEFDKEIRKVTMGCWIIVGRKTYETMKLTNYNKYIVITSIDEKDFVTRNQYCETYPVKSKEDAIKLLKRYNVLKVYILGGKSIFDLFNKDITEYIIGEYSKLNYVDGKDTLLSISKKKFNKPNRVIRFGDIEWYHTTILMRQDPTKIISSRGPRGITLG